MTDFLALSRRRQSCRSFSEKPVERDKLMTCIEAAHMAPSACNSQPWSFVVAENPELVAQIAKSGQPDGFNPFLDKAPVFVVILEEHATLTRKIRQYVDGQYFAKGDLGAVTAQLCLAAEDQGLGTCIIGVFDRDHMREMLGLSADKKIGSLIAVGYPANDTVRNKVRKPLEEIVRFL